MNAYLDWFLNTFRYETDDAAALKAAYRAIAASGDAAARLEEALSLYRAPACNHEEVIRLADEAANACGIHEYTAELLVYILLSETLRAHYRERCLPEAIFFDTMCDLCYKLAECKAVKGIVGTFVASWFAGFFEMTRFAFGRLQFELVPFETTYQKDGKTLREGDLVINVHIPRDGTPLDAARCEEAYASAAAFFGNELKGDVAFVCYSWLLYPENETILTDKSNIVRFMKRYDILRSGVNKNRPDLWRLFDTDEQNPDRLPTDTAARRRYVQHLKNGGKLGWGYGVFFW